MLWALKALLWVLRGCFYCQFARPTYSATASKQKNREQIIATLCNFITVPFLKPHA